jgi:hypothetical protein
MIKNLALVSCFGLVMAGTACAQESSPFAFTIGGGFTQPVGNTGRHLDNGA